MIVECTINPKKDQLIDRTNPTVSLQPETNPFPLQLCLCCGYSLTGLPHSGQCPECGLYYEPESIAFETKKEGHPFLMIIGLIVWVLSGYLMLRSTPSPLLGLLVLLLLIGGILYLVFGGIRSRRLIVNRNGMHIVCGRQLEKSLSWHEVKAFDISWVDGGLLVRTNAGNSITLCHDPKIAKACRKDLESALADYLERTQCRQAESPDC